MKKSAAEWAITGVSRPPHTWNSQPTTQPRSAVRATPAGPEGMPCQWKSPKTSACNRFAPTGPRPPAAPAWADRRGRKIEEQQLHVHIGAPRRLPGPPSWAGGGAGGAAQMKGSLAEL
ncbi:unnamed protein product [Prorocentrum cordatum]|uniref:Uncharacterized protein n=1 Tax=Prorocentrum cordatum TaxID=2364126 RepID=A0ABN9XPE6_9DINO|nr:unnamed protein product [Polarella glacialis]